MTTHDELPAETIDAANARLAAAGVIGKPTTHYTHVTVTKPIIPPITRKKRADAGKPRETKAVETRLGKLTETEANRLRILLEDVISAEKGYWSADANRCKAGIAYNAFVDELRAK